MSIRIGDAAPAFELPDQERRPVALEELLERELLLVFIPIPFTPTCEGELSTPRDRLGELEDLGAGVCVVTTDTTAANRRWAEDNGFSFPILSDYWPHGEVARSYGCFDEEHGIPLRHTFLIDRSGVVREVIRSGRLSVPHPFNAYREALGAIG